jgi:dephospho-CoA kinase
MASRRTTSRTKPLVIGFVGSIGCGKTARSQYLASLFQTDLHATADAAKPWAQVPRRDADAVALRDVFRSYSKGARAGAAPTLHRIDCDVIGHRAYEPGTDCYRAVVEHFGPRILAATSPDNDDAPPPIDRKALGSIVFADRSQLQALNGLVWPAIAAKVNTELDRIAGDHGSDACVFVEGALLIEIVAIATRCDALWFFTAERDVAVSRVVGRDGLSAVDAARRIDAQRSVEDRLKDTEQLPGAAARSIRVFDTSRQTVAEGCGEVADALMELLRERQPAENEC